MCIAKPCGELIVRGNLRKIEWGGKAGADNGGRDVAGGRDDVVIRGAAAAKFGDELIARAHVRGKDFTVMRLFERLEERWIGVAFPDQQAKRFGFRLASAE